MGTIISLDVGGLAIASSKNSRGYDHGFLFQPADRLRFPSQQIDADELGDDDPRLAEAEQGFVRALGSNDTSKLSDVLDAIVSVCTAMAEDMREDAAEQ